MAVSQRRKDISGQEAVWELRVLGEGPPETGTHGTQTQAAHRCTTHPRSPGGYSPTGGREGLGGTAPDAGGPELPAAAGGTALVGACLLLLPRSFQHPDSLSLGALLRVEPAHAELALTVAGVLEVPEPETFVPSALGEELADIHGEGRGFDSSDLILLSLTYRRYLYLRTLCFGGERKDAT